MPRSDPNNSQPSEKSLHVFAIVLLAIYAVSGATALAYEVLLAKAIGLQFGTSIFGVVITVSAFMAGLGLGSVSCVRWAHKIRFPLLLFAGLEFFVALLALAIPYLLQVMDPALARVSSGVSYSTWLSLQALLTAVLLFLPAFCMGAGFPLVLSAAQQARISIAAVYGVNTIGAALGALLPLLLLPALGWLSAMQVIALLGLLVAASAYYFHSKLRISTQLHTAQVSTIPDPWSLVAYAGIGAAAIMLEVSWTRIFGMLMLRTEYVLAVILATFLIGVGLGSFVSRWLRHVLWLEFLPLMAASFAVLSLWLIPDVALWADTMQAGSLLDVLLKQGLTIFALTVPVTLILGAWLPLLSARYRDQGNSGAWLYGVNSCGAAFGGLFAGFVVTPLLGTTATIAIAAVLLMFCGLRWMRDKRLWIGIPIVLAASVPVLNMPSVSILKPLQYEDAKDRFYLEDAINITHVVERPDGQRVLLADLQRMDASSEPTAVVVQKNQARLPLLLHAQPRNVLYLGLGTGISAAGGLDFPGLQQTAVEISKGAIVAASDWFAPVNANVTQTMNIVRDDARHFIMTDRRNYDVIVGDLFHPDMVGRSALLSLQQFARVRERLTADGIFVQWLALNQFSVEAFQTVARTFRAAFPDALLFVDAFRVALVGPNNGFSGAANVFNNLGRLTEQQQLAVTGSEGAWTWLGRYWGPIPEWPGVFQEEWLPRIEYSLPQARFSGELDLVKLLDMLLGIRPPVGRAAELLDISTEDFAAFERAYIATELAHRSWFAFLRKQSNEGQRLLQLAYQANDKDRWIGFALADGVIASLDNGLPPGRSEQDVLQAVLRIRPDHAEALQRLWRLAVKAGDTDKADSYFADLRRLDPLGSELLSH